MIWLDTLGWLVVGFGIGAACGWALRSMLYAREARETIRHEGDGMRDDGKTGYITTRAVIGVVLVLMAVSVGLSAKANNGLNAANDDLAAAASCNQKILKQTVKALNERTVYSDRAAKANQRVRDALRDVVTASVAKRPPSDAEARKIVLELGRALVDARALTKKAQHQRDQYGYPSTAQILNCPPQ